MNVASKMLAERIGSDAITIALLTEKVASLEADLAAAVQGSQRPAPARVDSKAE